MKEVEKLIKSNKEELLGNKELSYRTWLSKYGDDEAAIRKNGIAEAEAKLRLNSPVFGADAERSDSLGLSGSGYEDYLIGAGERAAANARDTAVSEGYLAKSRNDGGYKSYLSSYDELQRKSSEKVISLLNEKRIFSLERAYKYALDAGLNEENALYAATVGRRHAVENAIDEVVNYAIKNNILSWNAKQYAERLGLDSQSANIVADRVYSLTAEEERYFDALKNEDYLSYLKEKLEQEKNKKSET